MKDKLFNLLSPLIRECFRLKAIKVAFSEKYAGFTRFAGPFYSVENETGEIPECKACNNKMDFVFQFRINPFDNSGELIQLFYCFNCMPIGTEKDEGQWQIRVISQEFASRLNKVSESGQNLKFCIADSEKIRMLPDFETLEDDQPEIVQICKKIEPDDPWDVYDQACEAFGCPTEAITSVGGYPIWIQEAVGKRCSECHDNMDFIAQIDSVPEAGLMWGDTGCLYIFRCKKHPEKFAIEMQCF
jgi:hypothetical protein